MEQQNAFKILQGTAEYVESEFNKLCDQYMVIGSWVFMDGDTPTHIFHLSLIKPRSPITRLPEPKIVS